eukprot:1158875-Pelagomonas_calceolata.AAC.3
MQREALLPRVRVEWKRADSRVACYAPHLWFVWVCQNEAYHTLVTTLDSGVVAIYPERLLNNKVGANEQYLAICVSFSMGAHGSFKYEGTKSILLMTLKKP